LLAMGTYTYYSARAVVRRPRVANHRTLMGGFAGTRPLHPHSTAPIIFHLARLLVSFECRLQSVASQHRGLAHQRPPFVAALAIGRSAGIGDVGLGRLLLHGPATNAPSNVHGSNSARTIT